MNENPAIHNTIIGIVGRKGQGKTTAARAIFSAARRALVFDSLREYRFPPGETSPLVFFDPALLIAFLRLKGSAPFKAIYRPMPDRVQEQFDTVARAAYIAGDMLFCIEEIQRFCPTAGTMAPALALCIDLGRHRRLDLVYTTLRFARVARDVTSATDRFILFSVHEPADLDALESRVGKAICSQVRSFKLYQSLEWVPGGKFQQSLEWVPGAKIQL